MEFEHFALQAMANEIKQEMLLLGNMDPYSFVSPSAYDTAWLAMVRDDHEPGRPIFKGCLDWILDNQTEEGYWGECDAHGSPTIETVPATLACLVALKKWNRGGALVDKGLAYVRRNTGTLLGEHIHEKFPRWFAIMFPGMLELAREFGFELVFTSQCTSKITDIFYQRQKILESEKQVDKYHYPLLSYLEALPSTYIVTEEDIMKNLNKDGSLFQSPSGTAKAFMLTGNKRCLAYLKSLVQQCSHGVPQAYPLDEELIKLCVVNQVQNLGLAEHFHEEIEEILEKAYKNNENQEGAGKPMSSVAQQLHKDSLAFRTLRMHGYAVSPWSFCWFLKNQAIQDHIETNHQYFSSVMLCIYRATDLIFPGEKELEDARSFSRKLLEKNKTEKLVCNCKPITAKIDHEMKHPWIARPEHLDHRMLIEDENSNALWLGKASFHRMLGVYSSKLTQLALKNFQFRQSIYRNELEKLKMWTKKWGLSQMGFGREKTAYCYFAIATNTSLPHDSAIRMIAAKSGILITVADDYYDMEGSLNELKSLTKAVQRWDASRLKGVSKVIFNALDDIVIDVADQSLRKQGSDITDDLRYLWSETFVSWLREAEWSKSGYIPSKEEYLQNGMTSIATHTIAITASCLLDPTLPKDKLNPKNFGTLTKLIMIIPRLLNDTQSYKKEQEQGKINSVLLQLRENADMEIEDSVAYIKEIVKEKRKELLEHLLIEGYSDLPKSCRNLHFSCCKVFEMFFDTSNRFDSDVEMLQDIQRAFYAPMTISRSKPLENRKPLPPPAPLPRPLHDEAQKKGYRTTRSDLNITLKPSSS